MAVRVVEFSNGGYKITQRKLLNFENWVNGEVSKIGAACQIRKGGLEKGELVKQLRTQKWFNTTDPNGLVCWG